MSGTVVDGDRPTSAHQDRGQGAGSGAERGAWRRLGATGDGRGQAEVIAIPRVCATRCWRKLKELKITRQPPAVGDGAGAVGAAGVGADPHPPGGRSSSRSASTWPRCDRLIAGTEGGALAEAAQPNVVSGMRPITARDMRTGLDRPAGGDGLVPGRAGRADAPAVDAQHPRRLPGHHGRRGLLRRLQPATTAS